MADPAAILDEAYERIAAASFELPNGFVNHGAMACEALDALGRDDEVDAWARRFAHLGGARVEASKPGRFDPEEALGSYRMLGEWIGWFERRLEEDGWEAVVGTWVPRLMPAFRAMLFHAPIRVAHAVRAIAESDTPARRAELARALGYWGARYDAGPPLPADPPAFESGRPDGLSVAVVEAAARGARRYLSRPNIFFLHGVTGAMAVALLLPHLDEQAATAALARVRVEHDALYSEAVPSNPVPVGVPAAEVVAKAVASRDPHQVKLVEACRRGFDLTGDPAFVAAAETVTGLARS
ncbi:MAG: hypothetical protein FWC87_10310 [Acidimicrobiaceae bacterium]|nr:hypothetical protein [Acidimicrobiaceae bacterium]